MAGIAIIGCGQWGQNSVRTSAELGILRGICDANTEVTQRLGQTYDVPVYTWPQVLEEPGIRGVYLAVPAQNHVAMALEAIEAGKSVLVEKPVVLSLGDVDRLEAACIQHKTFVMGGHVLRYHPVFQRIQLMIAKGDLGTIQTIHAVRHHFGRIALGERNVLWSLGVHDVSLILALCGDQLPCTVDAFAYGPYSGQDEASVHLAFDTGVQAQIATSWLAPEKTQTLSIVGTQGSLFWQQKADGGLTFYPQGLGETQLVTYGQSYAVAVEGPLALTQELLHFSQCLSEQGNPLTDLHEIRRVTRVLHRIDQVLMGKQS
jgi:predicted dehydrogenase